MINKVMPIFGKRAIASTPLTPILDTYGGAHTAYSLRYLSTPFIGNAVVRVRRSSDNAESDFTPTEITDGTLTTWTGVNDGFVKTWYDQSGNANNSTQSTLNLQPKIVNNGALILENGKPYIESDGVDDFMPLDTAGLNIGNMSSFINLKRVSQVSFQEIVFGLSGGTSRWFIVYRSGIIYLSYNDAFLLNTGISADINALITQIAGATQGDYRGFVNGVLEITQTLSTEPSTNTQNGLFNIANNKSNSRASEFILYASDQSANRTGIESNINSYYSIY